MGSDFGKKANALLRFDVREKRGKEGNERGRDE